MGNNCAYCGAEARGAKECDRCWELSHRVEAAEANLLIKIIKGERKDATAIGSALFDDHWSAGK